MDDVRERGPEVDKLLLYAVKLGATDVLAEPGRTAVLQVRGALREADIRPLSARALADLVAPLLTGDRGRVVRADGQVTFTHTAGGGRATFRVRVSGPVESPTLAAHRVAPAEPGGAPDTGRDVG